MRPDQTEQLPHERPPIAVWEPLKILIGFEVVMLFQAKNLIWNVFRLVTPGHGLGLE